MAGDSVREIDVSIIVGKQGIGLELHIYSSNKHLLSSYSLQISALGPGETKVTKSQALLMSLRKEHIHSSAGHVPRDENTQGVQKSQKSFELRGAGETMGRSLALELLSEGGRRSH